MSTVEARYSIKEWPTAERPRERLETLGPRALSSRELLALLLETGSPSQGGRPAKSALDLAGDLLNAFSPGGRRESLRRIMTSSVKEMCRVPGIGPAKAAKILAALDLGRRAAEEARPEREMVRHPRDVYERVRWMLRDLPQEEFHVLLLNTHNEVLRIARATTGTADASPVHPREVFRAAVAEAAVSVVLVHNHPSGDPTPSGEDLQVTELLRKAGSVMQIPVLDHVVVGEGRYVSFVEAGLWTP
ncbi:MAG: repair protein RadC [Gemmatimonadetes bacterium]|nr:repair protein RadC [Gemmatimonadota bacterium]